MKYLVVLYKDSVVGQVYAGKIAGVRAGSNLHPALVCSEMDPSNLHCMFVKTTESQGQLRQSLHLPYDSVAFVVQFEEEEPNPVGFVPMAARGAS